MEDYAGNSHKSKIQAKDAGSANEIKKPKMEKVVSGKVTTRKKSELSKLARFFVPEDTENVKSYIIMDVIIPSIKKALTDTLDAILYPGGGKPNARKTTASKISYSGFYAEPEDRYRSIPRDRSPFDLEYVTFETKGDAKAVLNVMDEAISVYGVVSVGDFYDLANVSTTNHAINKYGWTNIRNAEVVRVKDGWIIKLPKPMPIA